MLRHVNLSDNMPDSPDVPKTAWALLGLMARPFRIRWSLFFGLSFLGILCGIAGPFVISKIVNELAASSALTPAVWTLVGFYAALMLGDEVLWRAAEVIGRTFKPAMIERVRTVMFAAVIKKSYSFFVNSSSGRIGHWINQSVSTMTEVVDTTMWTTWGSTIALILSGFFLFTAHWSLALLYGVWLVLLFAFTIYRGKTLAVKIAKQSNETSKAAGIVVDSVANHVSVRVFNARKREQIGLMSQQDKIVHLWRDAWLYNLLTNIAKGVSVIVASLLALLIVLSLYSAGVIKLGDIVLFVAYFGTASNSLWQLAWAFDNYFRQFGTIQNALDGLNGEEERAAPERDHPSKTNKVALELADLSFAYPERPDENVVSSLNLHIKAGEKIGVVGHSGAGKSTLVGLLLGFYEPSNGEIRINGENATAHDPSYIRSVASFVPQDSNLFNRSVKDNITYARPKATTDELTAALKQAQAYDFVTKLPKGIDTIIGERGVKLSGGQRQRLAIARAILQDAPLLIMDEATSALDSVSEQAIQRALHELMKQRTSIVIAHRLSTLKNLDRIVVLDKGQIAESGSHDELIALSGIYADLWKRQKDGFIVD